MTFPLSLLNYGSGVTCMAGFPVCLHIILQSYVSKEKRAKAPKISTEQVASCHIGSLQLGLKPSKMALFGISSKHFVET